MTWIKHIEFQNADGELQASYQAVYAMYPPEYRMDVAAVRRADGASDSVVAAHSLLPQALLHSMSAFGAMIAPDLPLTRRQHEMIATVVSAINGCFYWRESHAEFLRIVSLDAELAGQLARDHTQAALNDADRVMLDYAAKLTRHAARMAPEDLDRLRAVGFDDRAILQINLIASWFNYINRVADGLGVGR